MKGKSWLLAVHGKAALQKAAFQAAKDGKRERKRLSFERQKITFWKAAKKKAAPAWPEATF